MPNQLGNDWAKNFYCTVPATDTDARPFGPSTLINIVAGTGFTSSALSSVRTKLKLVFPN